MSRTYKDKPYKLTEYYASWRQDRVDFKYERDGCIWYANLYGKTTKTKKRKEVDTEDHWMTTPMWWYHMTHTKPLRRRTSVMLRTLPVDLEDADIPDYRRRPKVYFW